MKAYLYPTILIILFHTNVFPSLAQSFKSDQLRYSRVREARQLTEEKLKLAFKEKGLSFPPQKIIFEVFKLEAQLNVWVLSAENTEFKLFKSYPICSMSGEVGPKREQGDMQVPEGFYRIILFNPYSQFYLSMKINYPNASDKILSHKQYPGGDIFMHGSCVSAGCISITDSLISEVYWLATEVRNLGGNRLSMYIYPTQMVNSRYSLLKESMSDKANLFGFWDSLQKGYLEFRKNRKELNYQIDKNSGYYLF